VSVGSTGTSPDEADAVRYALSKDAVVVTAAGNTAQGETVVGTPGNIPGVVTVSGVRESGDFWDGSVHGQEVVVAAPATNIASAAPKEFAASGFSSSDGTSSAAAITSGVVALIRAKFPQLNAANVINRLITTAKDNGDPGRDPYFGFGTIRPVVALTADAPSVSANPLLSAVSSPSASSGTSSPSHLNVGNLVIIGLIVAVPLLVIVLAVVLAVRAGRRRPPGGSPGPGPGAPGYPPGYPPPPGNPPAAAYPPQSR
jgi:subtilisin family serine protease